MMIAEWNAGVVYFPHASMKTFPFRRYISIFFFNFNAVHKRGRQSYQEVYIHMLYIYVYTHLHSLISLMARGRNATEITSGHIGCKRPRGGLKPLLEQVNRYCWGVAQVLCNSAYSSVSRTPTHTCVLCNTIRPHRLRIHI